MSNNYWDEEDEDIDTITEEPSDKGINNLRKAKRANEKRIKELEEQLSGYIKKDREQSVAKVLEQKGVNPKAARLILKDLDEVNEQSVSNWLEDNGDLFGITQTQEAPQASETDRAALRQQDVITQGAITPDRAESLSLRMDQADNLDDFLNVLRSQ